MSVTETNPLETEASGASSFLEYRNKFLTDQINLADLLALPRTPELLDLTVPNPEEFSRPWPAPTNELAKISAGRWDVYDEKIVPTTITDETILDPSLYAPYVPIIKSIIEDAKNRGVDTNHDDIEISLKQGTAQEMAKSDLGNAHIDNSYGRQTRFMYVVCDRDPTNFFVHPFDVTDKTIDQALEEQRPEAEISQAEPYQVAMFDETLPHAAPQNVTDPNALRTVLRIWITSPNPYNQLIGSP